MPGSVNFPVVAVGGSAGVLDAYVRLLRHLPNDMGAVQTRCWDAGGYAYRVRLGLSSPDSPYRQASIMANAQRRSRP
jgi:hypothetical protein